VRWLTRAEADRLLEGCRAPHARLFAEIALRTGARSGAILNLTWDRVNLTSRIIDFREPGKAQTRKRRVPAAINDKLHVALSEALPLATTGHVIEYAGKPVARIKHAFADAAKRAGLPGVTPHVLRHTAVTWMMQAGIPVWQVAGFVGMTPQMVETVYGHHDPEHNRAAAKVLG
jgi:integrase